MLDFMIVEIGKTNRLVDLGANYATKFSLRDRLQAQSLHADYLEVFSTIWCRQYNGTYSSSVYLKDTLKNTRNSVLSLRFSNRNKESLGARPFGILQ